MINDFENKVIGSLSRIEQKVNTLSERVEDHEDRLRRAESAALIAHTLAERVKEDAARDARKKALLVGGAAGTVPYLCKAAWEWLTTTHR